METPILSKTHMISESHYYSTLLHYIETEFSSRERIMWHL